MNAFRTNCRSCGIPLKATKATYVAALTTLVIVAACVILVASSTDASNEKNMRRATVIPLAILASVIAYRFCGYEKAE